MMMTILARLGRDPEVRYTQSGSPVVALAVAYNYGKKDDTGNRPTQWVDASFFGERAEKIAPYLTKGSQVVLHLDEVHVHTYEKKDGGTGSVLRARVVDLEFAGSKPDAQPQAVKPARQAQRAAAPADEDIPF